MQSAIGARLWALVSERDTSVDGLFVYAVRSTGVFCRPSCPSRRPTRAHVTFFPSPEAAVAAGFRACRRCRPDAESSRQLAGAALGRACAAIQRAPERPWRIAAIASLGGMSVSGVRRAFRRALGVSPRDYVAACRRQRLLAELRRGTPVVRAVYEAGYGSTSRVYERKDNGVTLASYRKGGRGASMEWTTVASPIGRILVAATPRGVAFVAVGATDAELVRALGREYPHASIGPGSSARLRRFASAARAVAFGQPVSTDVPADVVGTAFQWRVWRALTRIPSGATRSYTSLAKAIGAPTAIRAAARACAINPVALLVPCHRVVGSDGELRGYRWGIAVKRSLLEREGRRA